MTDAPPREVCTARGAGNYTDPFGLFAISD